MMPKHEKRRDANEPEIVEALEKAGCLVERQDKFDLLVQTGRGLYRLEVKTEKGTLTAQQKDLIAKGWRVAIVRTPLEALKAVKLA